MAWVKRHLVLVVGAVIAVALIGVGTWYLLGSISKNNEVEAQLTAQKTELENLYNKDPFPHRTNMDAARREVSRVRSVIDQARQSFTPVKYENVKDMAFKTLLDNTIDGMHKRAEKTSVELPGKTYAFSFEAQKKALKFSANSFPAIAIQLAEVRTICDVLFDAKINRLLSVRRARLSADDPPGVADYVDFPITTNAETGAVPSPYQVEFNCFSSELAAALEGLYKSPNGLLVKALQVDTAAVEPRLQVPGPAAPAPPAPPGPPNRPPPGPPNRPPPRLLNVPVPVAGGVLSNVLNEKVLKVIMRIEVVKPAAGKT